MQCLSPRSPVGASEIAPSAASIRIIHSTPFRFMIAITPTSDSDNTVCCPSVSGQTRLAGGGEQPAVSLREQQMQLYAGRRWVGGPGEWQIGRMGGEEEGGRESGRT